MPELPEVETVRAGIAAHVIGRVITGVHVLNPRSIRPQLGGVDELRALVVGREIAGANRRGKYLWLALADDGEPEDHAVLIHLGMSGQVLIADDATPTHRHLRVRLDLDGDPGGDSDGDSDGDSGGGTRQLWFVDQRMFGYLAAVDLAPTPDAGPGGYPSPHAYLPETMTHIGRDLLDPALAPETPGRRALNRRIRSTSRGIKTVLLDQQFVSGIGNIYADEALWRVRLHYARPASRLTSAGVDALLEAATDVLGEALAAGGTSFDELYVNVAGESGYFERELAAYGREDEPCHRCGTPIVREAYANRSSFRCPRCQRRPASK